MKSMKLLLNSTIFIRFIRMDEFEMSDLEQLPDNKWEEAPLNGAEHIY